MYLKASHAMPVTAISVPQPIHGSAPRTCATLAIQIRVLTLRLLQDLLTSPSLAVMRLIFGAGFVVAYNGALGHSPAIAQEVHGHYLAFVVPSGVLIATFASSTGGYMLARDIEDGYLDYLLANPVSRFAIVVAPMLVGAIFAVVQAASVLALSTALGVHPTTGVLGTCVMLVIVAFWGMAITGYMTATALISRDVETTRLVDVCAFSLLFFCAPVLLPRDDLQSWLKTIARFDPATYVLEGLRDLMQGGWYAAAILPALAAAGGFALFTVACAAAAATHSISRGR